jgi:hypothetical protein
VSVFGVRFHTEYSAIAQCAFGPKYFGRALRAVWSRPRLFASTISSAYKRGRFAPAFGACPMCWPKVGRGWSFPDSVRRASGCD